MRSERLQSILVAAVLIIVAAGYRLLPDGIRPSNFQAVGAVALFSGFYFASARAFAWLVPMAAMILSNLVIGGYEFDQMLVVNAAIVLPAFYGYRLQHEGRLIQRLSEAAPLFRSFAQMGRIALYSLGGSLLFFILSNFAVWLFSGMYPVNFEGLVQCYLMAIPFYGQDTSMSFLGGSILGDLCFNGLFFGAWALYTQTRRLPYIPAAI
ncbi:MAG: hypothetical protein K1X75_11805 [Leptospirales bacterium]|nr:hypothetical protein [Leptospirales bacterium]